MIDSRSAWVRRKGLAGAMAIVISSGLCGDFSL
jgi:hypothetical protein